jgi:Uma2 family endonuclease
LDVRRTFAARSGIESANGALERRVCHATRPNTGTSRFRLRVCYVVAKLGRTTPAWKVYCSPIVMVLTPRRVVQPDVLFVARERLDIVGRAIKGAADLVAEVLSESSHERDRIKKRDLYEQHGVKEYWLLDREGGTVEVLILASGEYQLAGRWRTGGTARSKLLKGFRVKVAEILR